MSDQSTQLVIFDCDGVIIDSEIISADMLIEVLKPFRVDIDRKFVSRHFLGRSYQTVFSDIRQIFGVELPPEFEGEYRKALLERFAKDLRAIPGVKTVAQNLNCAYCVATSSTPERVRRSLEIVDLLDLFHSNLFTAGEVENGKPAPDLMLHAARKMNVQPERCLVIEDSYNGIRAARAAQMKVARFVGGSHIAKPVSDEPDDARPHLRFDSFSQFFDYFPDLSRH